MNAKASVAVSGVLMAFLLQSFIATGTLSPMQTMSALLFMGTAVLMRKRK